MTLTSQPRSQHCQYGPGHDCRDQVHIPHICPFWYTTALVRPIKVHQKHGPGHDCGDQVHVPHICPFWYTTALVRPVKYTKFMFLAMIAVIRYNLCGIVYYGTYNIKENTIYLQKRLESGTTNLKYSFVQHLLSKQGGQRGHRSGGGHENRFFL